MVVESECGKKLIFSSLTQSYWTLNNLLPKLFYFLGLSTYFISFLLPLRFINYCSTFRLQFYCSVATLNFLRKKLNLNIILFIRFQQKIGPKVKIVNNRWMPECVKCMVLVPRNRVYCSKWIHTVKANSRLSYILLIL